MKSGNKFLLYAVIGLIGGAASFAAVDLIMRFQESFSSYLIFNLVLGASFGILIGACLGSAEGIVQTNRHKILTGIIVGVVVGAIGGILGVYFGQSLLLSLLEKRAAEGAVNPVSSLIFHALSWAIMGLFIGMVEGIRARSGIKILYGMLGGLLGGIFGGLILEALSQAMSGYVAARLLGLLALGGMIGIFYAILERNFTPGVLRVLNGSLKGKKLALNQRKLTIGFSPRNDLALPGYKDVEKLHAVITVRGDQVNLEPFRHVYSLYVNDMEEQETTLKYHDVIRIGDARFLYEVK